MQAAIRLADAARKTGADNRLRLSALLMLTGTRRTVLLQAPQNRSNVIMPRQRARHVGRLKNGV
jgi:hypothetical protein